MANLTSVEEQRRRLRHTILGAFLLLVLIWTVKLAFPQHTILSTYRNHRPPQPEPISPDVRIHTGEKGDRPAATAMAAQWRPATHGTGLPEATLNGSISSKVAVIVETKFRVHIVPFILHYNSVLGPDWPILIYTTVETVSAFATSAALARYIKTGAIQLRLLPQEVLFTDSNSVNRFMTDPWLWEDLHPAEHVLVFQSDSILCANAARSMEDFLAYDFIGASMVTNPAEEYNRGLSLRRRKTILRVLDTFEWDPTLLDRFEDVWFFNRMRQLGVEDTDAGIGPEAEGAIQLPTPDVARTFGVQTDDFPHPLGVQNIHGWAADKLQKLDEWCPEHKLCFVNEKAKH